MSSTFYVLLWCPQIPKVKKDSDDPTVFFMLLGSTSVKAVSKMSVKLTPGLREELVRQSNVILPTLFLSGAL